MRLQALADLDVLDSGAETEFSALVQAAALVCGAPISLISLVDASRQWFKAQVGLPGVSQTPREQAFCAHAILKPDLLEVPDALADPRFADNPLVLGEPRIRFYAGVPLTLANGQSVGTLCVIDRQPRLLTTQQREVLTLLASAAVQALETRRLARAQILGEGHFKALTEAVPLGVYATDANGSCTYTSPRWQQVFGLGAEDSLGHGWSRTLHPDDRACVTQRWQQAADTQQTFDMDFRVLRDDGQLFHVRSVARPVLNHEGVLTAWVGAVEDVTARKLQDEALRLSDTLLRRTGELAQVGGWEVDLASSAVTWSDQTCLIHGVPPGHRPTLEQAIEFYAPEARPVIQAAVQKGMVDGSTWDLELPFIQAGGQRRWVRAVGHAEFVGGRPVRLLGAFQDITEKHGQRLMLEAAHQRVALATQSGKIGVWECDVQADRLSWDPRMYSLYGLAATEGGMTYDTFVQCLHPDDRNQVVQALQAAMEGSRDYDTEFRVLWPDGSTHHLRGAATVVRDPQGQPLRINGVNWDVTDLRQMSLQLAEQHALLQVTLQSIGDAVITTDARGQVAWLNPVAERMTGWKTAEAKGRPLAQVFHIVNEETRLAAESPVAACVQQDKVVGLADRTVLLSRDGAEYGIEDSAAPIRSESGELLGVVLVFHDVTEQRRLSGEMSYRASHDALTGLCNRAEFETRLRRTLNTAHEEASQHALLYIDLDQFKLVNDACGHSVGDQLLQQVAKLLGAAVRARDTLARLGGDEFAVILEHCTGEQAQRVAQQICDRMDEFRFAHDGRRFRIGASIGLVPLDARWVTPAAVMQAADTSCYAAKEAGRNRVHAWFDTDKAIRARHGEMQWATRLAQALDEDRFVLYGQRIQPLQRAAQGLHAEVLIRLLDDQGELVPPGAFLPAAERFNLSSRIDRWVLSHALQQLAEVPDPSAIELLCVNLSGQSIGDRAFHRHAIELLQGAGAALCARVCLEITETAAVTNLADAAVFIGQVRALGVRVALDDFGAGASSFGYLKTLGVDLLKIDGQYIKDVIDDPLDAAAVRCFVDVARVVGVATVAEFVDRPEVLQRVTELGVDYAQGFLLHRPEPLRRVLGLVVADAPPVARSSGG